MKKLRTDRKRRLQYETLESRQLMAANVFAGLSSGVLTVYGTDGDDQVAFYQTKNKIGIHGVAGSWKAPHVSSIVVNLGDGDDFVSLQSLANGGKQALAEVVTVHSGLGDETVRLATGNDVVFSGLGHALVVATTGTATLDGEPVAGDHPALGATTAKVTASLSKTGVLMVYGTTGDDQLKFRQTNNVISIVGVSGAWTTTQVKSISVYLQGGNDSVSLASLANGGKQALAEVVTVYSGAGDKTVRLASGKDVQFSGAANTLVVAADGTAKFNGVTVSGNNPTPAPNPAPNPPSGNWFTTTIKDVALRTLGNTLYADNLINRNDIIALLRSAEDGGIIDSTELADLKAIVANTTLFGGIESVWKLTSYIVNGNTANTLYQGATLGNLAANSTTAHMEKLIGKWFLGLDRPTAAGTYRQFSGQLFVNGTAYTDIRQGAVGDCYFVAALAETALRNPNLINNMFTVNGDGTYTVKFFNAGKAEYVTVDSFLPTYSSGAAMYAGMGQMYNNAGNELWVALAEKAYAQLNSMGWLRPGLPGNGQNSYSGIEGGYIYAALGQVTGQATVAFAMTSSSTSFTTFVNAWNAGKSIGFASKPTPAAGSGVVGSHAYVVVGYNTSNQTVTLFNPWGTQYGLLNLTWSQIQTSFSYFDRTA